MGNGIFSELTRIFLLPQELGRRGYKRLGVRCWATKQEYFVRSLPFMTFGVGGREGIGAYYFSSTYIGSHYCVMADNTAMNHVTKIKINYAKSKFDSRHVIGLSQECDRNARTFF